jgi:hypothetical protein
MLVPKVLVVAEVELEDVVALLDLVLDEDEGALSFC